MHLVGFIIRIYHDARSSECQKKMILLFSHFTVTLLYLMCIICKTLSLFIWLIFFHYYILVLIFSVLLVILFFSFFLSLFCLVCGIRFAFNLVRAQFQEFIQPFIPLSFFHSAFASTFSCFCHYISTHYSAFS